MIFNFLRKYSFEYPASSLCARATFESVIGISVLGYWKVSFYPLNTDTDSFYRVDTDIDTEVNYPKFYTEILENTSTFQYQNDCLKPQKRLAWVSDC